CSLKKQFKMIKAFLLFYEKCKKEIEAGTSIDTLLELPIREETSRLKEVSEEEFDAHYALLEERVKESFETLTPA
ncbi:MAG TPA: hypothetical protein ACFYD1_09385, partial [Candidatus Hypogeohydataceae bacterium YC38]